MAWVHPDDEAFSHQDILAQDSIRGLFTTRLGLDAINISSSEDQGVYHKIYFVSLSEAEGNPWSGRDVVLRVARKAFVKIKTEDEVAVLQLLRESGVPVPRVVFFSSDPDDPLGYEYNCLEKISYPSLEKIWQNLSATRLDGVLDQFVDIFIRLFDIGRPGVYGGLALGGGAGPVVEQVMWQYPDIVRYFHNSPYNLTSETFTSLNPTGFYNTWPDYISAFLKSYHHIASIHPSVAFLRQFLPRLQSLIDALDKPVAEPWIQHLRASDDLRPRLFHADFHFGNILADMDGTIKSIVDWEFARMGPPFSVTMSLIKSCVADIKFTYPNNAAAQELVKTWPAEFEARLQKRAPDIAATWARESDSNAVLGIPGKAAILSMSLEYGVRGHESVEVQNAGWVHGIEQRLQTLGFMK
ncbi:kinase-like domain-containing protein [Mycena amicta]|nr:kinase-like domain-containing protein [Mycena amicta]